MSADHAIDAWLNSLGFELPAAHQRARALLEEAGLTRTGKQRISDEKLPRATEHLRSSLFVHCASVECTRAASQSGREAVATANKGACEHCGGSANKRAEADLVAACQRAGVKRIVIVGGSPAVREELAALEKHLELRLVDGTERRTSDRAKADLAWADLVLLWGASELHHKVSMLYSNASPPLKKKVVHVAKRGVAALLSEAVTHLQRG